MAAPTRPGLVVHVPHAATWLPVRWRGQFGVARALLDAEAHHAADLHTDSLARQAWPDAGIVAAAVSRVLVDVERYEDDAREEYDADGRLLAIRWLDGDVVTFGHDATGLAWVEDRRGRRIELAYSGGRLSGLQLPDGRAVAYGYGWLVRQNQDPALEPVMVRSRLVWLTRAGSGPWSSCANLAAPVTPGVTPP